MLAQNNIPNTIEQQLAALDKLGGLDALGGPKTDNMYHAGWAWAGSTPFQHTKLVASHFGGTRNPLVVSWPKRIKPDKTPRAQFHHVNDIAPTIYEILGIKPPKVVDGFTQDPIDGVSMAYTFADATTPTRKRTQYFENNGSRGIYHDGWYRLHVRSAHPVGHGRLAPAISRTGMPNKDVWELYDLQQGLLAGQRPRRQGAGAARRAEGAVPRSRRRPTRPFRSAPASGCACIPRIGSRRPTRAGSSTRRPPACPNSPRRASAAKATIVTIDAEFGENASGVLYALGGSSGGLTLFMDKGELVYEYNMLIIERYHGALAVRS